MSRFLFVVLPLAGHVNPAWTVGQALSDQGHEVAWVGSQSRLRRWLGPDATVYPTGMRLFRGRSDFGLAAVKSLWEGFLVPFARFSLPAVEKAIAAFQPDVLVVDQHALAGALAAHRGGLPWATLCTSPMELAQPFRDLPRVETWIRAQIEGLSAWAGLTAATAVDLRFSPHLVVALTTGALLRDAALPSHFALVGPVLGTRPVTCDFPWERLDPQRRHVLVSMGTLADDVATEFTDFYARAVEGLRPLGDGVQGIVVTTPEAVPGAPGHVIVQPAVPQLELMPHLDAVICHGGMNTVGEALSYGIPLVVAPITRDQPITAAQVQAAGAGIRVRFTRVTPGQLGAALTEVMENPGYRAAAQRVSSSFAAAGGAQAAADRLVLLGAGTPP